MRVLETRHGELGLQLAQERQPDVILLDLQLPDLAGETELCPLKADECAQRVLVIVLRADMTARLSAQLLELGSIQCLRKPDAAPNFCSPTKPLRPSAKRAFVYRRHSCSGGVSSYLNGLLKRSRVDRADAPAIQRHGQGAGWLGALCYRRFIQGISVLR